ncbi:MAG TPA: hypothetical protein VEY67_01795, partial [Candidatus Dormibacteraeota bacterium]|nr:hypothetical protein [Candidatus Dormibacteraeota bacterium]
SHDTLRKALDELGEGTADGTASAASSGVAHRPDDQAGAGAAAGVGAAAGARASAGVEDRG